MKLTPNVGGWDRFVRLCLGVILMDLALLGAVSGAAKTLVFILALIALLTGIFNYCPANRLLGIDTRKTKEPGSVQ